MGVNESLGQKLWTLSHLSESSDVPAGCSSDFDKSVQIFPIKQTTGRERLIQTLLIRSST